MLISLDHISIDWIQTPDGRHRPFRLRAEIQGREAYCLDVPSWFVDAVCVHKTAPPHFSPFEGKGVWVSVDPDSLREEPRFVVLGGRLYDLQRR